MDIEYKVISTRNNVRFLPSAATRRDAAIKNFSCALQRATFQIRAGRVIYPRAFVKSMARVVVCATKGFDPAEVRVPAGSSGGGEWTNGAAGGSSITSGIVNGISDAMDELSHYFETRIGDAESLFGNIRDGFNTLFGATPAYAEMPTDDEEDLMATEGAMSPTRFGGGGSGGNTSGLNDIQAENYARFQANMPKNVTSTKITNLPDGSAIFTGDSPARNIPGSFGRYEKIVDPAGNTVRFSLTTYAPDGSIVDVEIKHSK